MGALGHMPPIWLDVTRLLTRVGRGALTGVDRVELAYLETALDAGCVHYLCRTTRGYLLLDRRGALCLRDMALGDVTLGRSDAWSRLTARGDRPRHKAEAMLRSLAVDRCRPSALSKLLGRHGTTKRVYLNVGHSNLSEATLRAFAAPGGADWRMVLIHDLIPITHPQFVVDSQPEAFAGRIERVRRHATHVIANSHVTDADLEAHWSGQEMPKRIVAPLGVEPRALSHDLEREPRHFVMLGTVEARKNHALILDVWDLLAEEMSEPDLPTLHIIGAVGWKVEAFMERLTKHPLFGGKIKLNGPHGLLDDGAVQDQLARATALLFPSLAEGYGLPPLEAVMAGVTPICSNLPVFHETLGDCAVYVDSNDAYQWKETIKQYLEGMDDRPDLSSLKVPTWQEHFEIVADAIIQKTPEVHA